jgi:transposase
LKVDELLDHVRSKVFVADASYDSDRVRAALKRKRIKAVINNASGRDKKRRVEKRFYRLRYLVECFFHRLKLFRAIATRYEKTARNYLAIINLACAWLWLN